MAAEWEFWIDVGGTFTDCIYRRPDDSVSTLKVLSSGITKGIVEETTGTDRIVDSARRGDPEGFWSGYTIRFLNDAGLPVHTATVRKSQGANGVLAIEQPLPADVTAGTRYELDGGEEAPIQAIRRAMSLSLKETIPPVSVRLGTTRGTNALLTRNGARTAFVTTRGFQDVLLIGNQDRPRLFDLAIQKPEPLFEQTIEIDERMDADGTVLGLHEGKPAPAEYPGVTHSSAGDALRRKGMRECGSTDGAGGLVRACGCVWQWLFW